MFVPGRIEFLGKHTDYCGGQSIVCAIDRGFQADVTPRKDSQVVLENLYSGETASFCLGSEESSRPGHWINYAIEVGRRLTRNFTQHLLRGADIRFKSDLPKAAGLSSSSALMIIVYAALESANDLRGSEIFETNIKDDLDLAEYLGCVENGRSFRALAGSAGVGTFGGSQDHAAILLGRRRCLSRFSFSPLSHESDFAFPEDYKFVVASSGVAAEKTGAALGKYNRISRMVLEITNCVGSRSLAQAIDEIGINELRSVITEGQFSFSASELLDRVEQFYIENFEIIPAVSKHLAARDFENIGDLIDTSHQNAERLLGNQIEETSFLQRSAREIGAKAASAFGAGFGGSVYALVKTSEAEQFTKKWRRTYLQRFPQRKEMSEFFITLPSQIQLEESGPGHSE